MATISSTPVMAPAMPVLRIPVMYSSDSCTSPSPAAAISFSTMAPSLRSAGMKNAPVSAPMANTITNAPLSHSAPKS